MLDRKAPIDASRAPLIITTASGVLNDAEYAAALLTTDWNFRDTILVAP
jgi:hypothetical protein